MMRAIREQLSREMVGKSYDEQRRILDSYVKRAGLEAKFRRDGDRPDYTSTS